VFALSALGENGGLAVGLVVAAALIAPLGTLGTALLLQGAAITLALLFLLRYARMRASAPAGVRVDPARTSDAGG
jgi:hypothetical protein